MLVYNNSSQLNTSLSKDDGSMCDLVRYPSVSLSLTLTRNEKVEQHIIKKIHKPNVLRFWVEGGVIPLCIGLLFSFLWDLPGVSPFGFSQQVVSEPMVCVTGLDEYNLIPVSKVLLTEVLGKHVPFKCVNSDTSERVVCEVIVLIPLVRYPSVSQSPILNRNEKLSNV